MIEFIYDVPTEVEEELMRIGYVLGAHLCRFHNVSICAGLLISKIGALIIPGKDARSNRKNTRRAFQIVVGIEVQIRSA